MSYTPFATIQWRDELRFDYARTFPPVLPAPRTALGYGSLFPLVDPAAKLNVTMLSRAFTDAEWEEWRRSPACERRRKPGETIEERETLVWMP